MSTLAREPKATNQNENITYKGKPEMTLPRHSGAKECESSFWFRCPPNPPEAKPNDAKWEGVYCIVLRKSTYYQCTLSTSIPAVVEQASFFLWSTLFKMSFFKALLNFVFTTNSCWTGSLLRKAICWFLFKLSLAKVHRNSLFWLA